MQNSNVCIRRISGFSLIEMVATLAVASITAAMAVPDFHAYVLNVRRDSVVDSLTSSMHYARNQALNLDQAITLCAGVAGTNCIASWTNGWEVVSAPAGSATVALSSHATHSSDVLTLVSSHGSKSFAFDGRGLVTNMGANGSEIITVCDARGASAARAVEINRAGYIQSSPSVGLAPDGTTPLSCS